MQKIHGQIPLMSPQDAHACACVHACVQVLLHTYDTQVYLHTNPHAL